MRGIQKQPRQDRYKLVALVMASLVAGLLLMINFDRVTHASRELELGESRHGFPLVYLTRQLEDAPAIFIRGRTYSWPWPPVKGEIRQWSYENLALDFLFGSAAVLIVYFVLRAIVFRYDKWKYRL